MTENDELLQDLEWLVNKYEDRRPTGTMVAAIAACVRGSIHLGNLNVLYELCFEFAHEQISRLRRAMP